MSDTGITITESQLRELETLAIAWGAENYEPAESTGMELTNRTFIQLQVLLRDIRAANSAVPDRNQAPLPLEDWS